MRQSGDRGACRTHLTKRCTPSWKQPFNTSEVAIESNLKQDYYLTLAGWEDAGKSVASTV